jgi:hypothetical protein
VGMLSHCFHHHDDDGDDDDDDGYNLIVFGPFFEFVLWCIVTWKLPPIMIFKLIIHPFFNECKANIRKPCYSSIYL